MPIHICEKDCFFLNFLFCLAFLLVDSFLLHSGTLNYWLLKSIGFADCESLSAILLGAGAPDFHRLTNKRLCMMTDKNKLAAWCLLN